MSLEIITADFCGPVQFIDCLWFEYINIFTPNDFCFKWLRSICLKRLNDLETLTRRTRKICNMDWMFFHFSVASGQDQGQTSHLGYSFPNRINGNKVLFTVPKVRGNVIRSWDAEHIAQHLKQFQYQGQCFNSEGPDTCQLFIKRTCNKSKCDEMQMEVFIV